MKDYDSEKLRKLQSERVFCAFCGMKNVAEELASFDPITGERTVYGVEWRCPGVHSWDEGTSVQVIFD